MNLKKYFSSDFLFNINSLGLQRSDKIFVISGIVGVVLAVLFKVSEIYAPLPVDKKYRSQFFKVFLSFGIAEIIWYGCRVQYVRFFGSHFVALVIGLIAAVWFLVVLVNMIKNYSQEKTVWEKEQVRAKYLPK